MSDAFFGAVLMVAKCLRLCPMSPALASARLVWRDGFNSRLISIGSSKPGPLMAWMGAPQLVSATVADINRGVVGDYRRLRHRSLPLIRLSEMPQPPLPTYAFAIFTVIAALALSKAPLLYPRSARFGLIHC
ncbi:hypothetical protein BTO02_10010 [Paraburkholderia sp. SOS3]|nr:hypothetical protein BTO02_10010 [Paraburkholderia sp. SOS3]